MLLADMDLALKMGLIGALVGGGIGAVVGLIRWLAKGGKKRGKSSNNVNMLDQAKSPKDGDNP